MSKQWKALSSIMWLAIIAAVVTIIMVLSAKPVCHYGYVDIGQDRYCVPVEIVFVE